MSLKTQIVLVTLGIICLCVGVFAIAAMFGSGRLKSPEEIRLEDEDQMKANREYLSRKKQQANISN